MTFVLARKGVIAAFMVAILLPTGILAYQSLLTAPFFMADASLGLQAYRFVLSDPDFWSALQNSLAVAAGMVVVAVPTGAALAFLMARTDIPGRSIIEPCILAPMLIPSIVMGVGYSIAAGPVGIYSAAFERLFGFVPWNVYTPVTITIIAGLTAVPYVYLYTSTALRGLSSDLEEAARIAGASTFRMAVDVSLPMIMPAILFSAIFVFFIGIELFGLPLVLGGSAGFDLLSTYLYKLTTRLGVPSYQLMAAVVVLMATLTLPLIYLQRRLLGSSSRFISVKGKAARSRLIELGPWRYVGLAFILLWLFVAAFVPLTGIVIRALVEDWSAGADLWGAISLDPIRAVFQQPVLLRGIVNSVLIGVVGGAAAVACYAALALSVHRRADNWTLLADYLVLIPRAMPGLVVGLAFLWLFLFFPPLKPMRSSLIAVWIAYMTVYLAYGLRLLSGVLVQIGPELTEAAKTCGANGGRVLLDITMPLMRNGLFATWLLIFLMFEREYAAGVYLLTTGTEVIGTLLVSLSESGDISTMAALSIVNLVLIGAGLGVALKFGIRING